jgi:hypothetical protein
MRRSLFRGLIAGAVLLSTAGAASAGDMFLDFNAACLKTAGDRKAALAFADAAGWTTPAPGTIPQTAPNFKLKDVALRANTDAVNRRMLVVGTGETAMAGRAVPADLCMIAGLGVGEVAAQVKALLGADATMTMTMNMPNAGASAGPMTLSMYMFHETPNGRAAVSLADLAGAGPSKPLTMIMVMLADQSKAGMVGRIVLNP